MTASEPERDRSRAGELSKVYQKYADPRYSERWSAGNSGNAAIIAERSGVLEALVRGWRQSVGTVLDVGCGSATLLPPTLTTAHRTGVDLLLERVQHAADLGSTDAVMCADGTALPIRTASFEAVVLSTVFSSVLDPAVRRLLAAECSRVLTPGGAVIWYDMRLPNPRNSDIASMTRREVAELFVGFDHRWKSLTVLPPLTRRLGRTTGVLYPWLSRVPALRTHLAGVFVKPT